LRSEAVDLAIHETFPLGTKANDDAYQECNEEIIKRIGEPSKTPVCWNDEYGNFLEEVLFVLRTKTYASA
jgi:hypothetical protein